MNDGWFKVWRKIWDNEFLRRNDTAFKLFIWCISMADKKTHKFTTGRRQIERATGIKQTTAYYNLKKMEKLKMLDIKSNNQFSEIYIYNYGKYQLNVDSKLDNELTTIRQRVDNELTLNKNRELRIKNKEVSKETVEPKVRSELSKNIDIAFKQWEEKIGYPITSKIKANRYAASNLLKKHGPEVLERLLNGVVLAQEDKFAPQIGDYAQLQSKLNQLMAWGKQQAYVNDMEAVNLDELFD